MCSETSPPRLSFSSDLGQTDVRPLQDHRRRDTSLLDMNCDFEFSISSCSQHESSSADELFSHGIILPIRPRERVNSNFAPSKETKQERDQNSLPPLPNYAENSKRETHKETTVVCPDHLVGQTNKPQSKSFWGSFKRSSSLNCENKRTSLLCSLPLLSRSNSTGSVPIQKRNSYKEVHNKNSNWQKQPLISRSSSSSSSSISNPYSVQQKPPLKKNYGGSYGNSVRIIPVINVPPPYIPKGTAKLFGLGSFLQHGKDRKSKKNYAVIKPK
ncbi:uncharacterized protein LOC21402858 [Morus notabilis]|nr:uncharacterized protein LOC21402858 [Morus notabilis]